MRYRRQSLRFLLAAAAFAASAAAPSRPVVIEESQWLERPQAGWTFFGESVAIDGDWALATAIYSATRTYEYPYQQMALLYRRSGSVWVFDRVLVNDTTDAVNWNYPYVAMKNGLAAVSTTPLRVFQRNGEAWTALPHPFSSRPDHASWANGRTRIDGTTVASIAGRCRYSAITSDRIAGQWTAPRLVAGNSRTCTLSNYASSLDVDGNRLVFTGPQEHSESPPSETRIYRRNAPGEAWQLDARLPVADFGFAVALRGEELFVGSWDPLGNEIYRRGAGGWALTGHLPTLAGFGPYFDGARHFGKDGEFILTSTSLFDGLPPGIAVYRRDAGGRYRHLAQLASSRGDWLGPVAEISGRQIVVGGFDPNNPDLGRLYFFELPEDLAAPPVLTDDFEDGNATGWTMPAGAFSVVRRGPSFVLRQSDSIGSAVAVLAASNRANQAAQADLRPIVLNGTASFGLATRYLDSANHYAAVLSGQGGVVELRRVRTGETVVLASRPLAVSQGGRYRVRLESIGSRHRLYVNGQRLFDVLDGALDRGRVAVITAGASTDIDNVLVTHAHRTPLYTSNLDVNYDCDQFVGERYLRQSGSPQWDCTDYELGHLRQTSLTGIARAAIGPVTDDQVVESRMQLEQFAPDGTADKWLGVMTRYTDENNYYYFVLRSSKMMSLRKLVDGAIVELGRAGFTLGTGSWHTFRLEAVGNRLRGYVNGQLLIQAVDSSHPRGVSGIATYRAAAHFDYLRVVQP
jgi:hypothetical protein